MFGKNIITIFAINNALIIMYYERLIDRYLSDWASDEFRKPMLLRGARQVGKSTAIRHLGEKFESYVEINFERQPEFKALFKENLVVTRIVSEMGAMLGEPIVPGKTLLFFDEIQSCPEAIMSLRFFKEDMPQLHVIAAGSLLEFALAELPTFGVGRIHSMFMYPMTFDEFLLANGEKLLMDARDRATQKAPLSVPLHNRLVALLRTYMLVGGMPEVVARWVSTHDYLRCNEVQDDIVVSYEDDFPKYGKKIDPMLLRMTLHSVAAQGSRKFSYADVGGGYRSGEIKKALGMLMLAGLCVPVTRTDANGLPLGSEADSSYRKILLFDTGIMLRLLNMSLGDAREMVEQILTANDMELVNKGPMTEILAGLEMIRYKTPNMRHELFFWLRPAKNSQAEIDYLTSHRQKVLPVEVKAGMRGGMKSLWIFMREKKLSQAVRCSLENFGEFEYVDKEADDAVRHVTVCPLYAISRLQSILP